MDNRPRSVAAVVALLLLLGAMASNIYLAHLYVQVRRSPAGTVESFCNISESANCVAVAASHYASFLGVPVALFGAEYYGLTSLIVVLGLAGWARVRRWDALVFWAMVLALPFSLLMAYLAIVRLRSICVLCSSVYLVNFAVLGLLAFTQRGRIGGLLRDGIRELRRLVSRFSAKLTLLVLGLAGLSQLFWVPDLIGGPLATKALSHADPLAGVAKTGLSVGVQGAPITIEMFTDFQCAACAEAHGIIVKVLKRFADKVYFIHRDFPLDAACNRSIARGPRGHDQACLAAVYARCAAAQQLFWPYAGLLFDNRHSLNPSVLLSLAAMTDLDLKTLKSCTKRPKIRQAVLDDIERGIRQKLRGTPTFIVNGEEVLGPRNLAWWNNKITSLLEHPAP